MIVGQETESEPFPLALVGIGTGLNEMGSLPLTLVAAESIEVRSLPLTLVDAELNEVRSLPLTLVAADLNEARSLPLTLVCIDEELDDTDSNEGAYDEGRWLQAVFDRADFEGITG